MCNNKDNKVIDNIYTINKDINLWGTHAYLINNKNINKIYESLLNIDCPIDRKFKNNIINNILIGYVIYPILVDQNIEELNSDIRPYNLKNIIHK